MVNVEINLYGHDNKVETRQMNLTEDGFVELLRMNEADRTSMVCGLMNVEAKAVSRVVVELEKEEV